VEASREKDAGLRPGASNVNVEAASVDGDNLIQGAFLGCDL